MPSKREPKLELVLRYIVFERKNEPGNFVIVDPTLDPVIAIGASGARPTLYVARDRHAVEMAAECMLHELEISSVNSAGRALVEKIRDGLARLNGHRADRHGRLRQAA